MQDTNEQEVEESVNYFQGEIVLYVKGKKLAMNMFDSKSNLTQIMDEWKIQYQYVEGLEFGVIFD